MRPAIFLPDASRELEEASLFYERRSGGLGKQFEEEIESAVKDIQKDPEIWPFFKENTRRRLLKRFPFAILYRVDATEIVIVAVAHLSRKPDYWKDR
ncbi:MAG: type II toxin-antitoxin system RelE/ParE family toxin [Candidatus Lokiarchaeota archaeon]|nr:type II toxin-antitoxin system RelE/ParE family toxin [Candidatus Lokiarchaeota archaeon]